MNTLRSKSEPTLEDVLERASSGNEILVTHSDGSIYSIRKIGDSPTSAFDQLGIPRIQNSFTIDEIVQLVREGRQRVWDPEIKAYREGPWPGDDDYDEEQEK